VTKYVARAIWLSVSIAADWTRRVRHTIIRNGEQYNVSVREILPGANGTVATCRELPGLMKIGDDHDDALRRMVEAIERRAGRAR
jgi:hypothetical protein